MQDLVEDVPLHIGRLRLHCAGDNVQIVQGGQIAQGSHKHVSKSFSFSHNHVQEYIQPLPQPGAAAGQAKVCKPASQTEFR